MQITIKRLQKDIEDLFKICQMTMVLNVKKTVTDPKENEDQWTIMKKSIKDELNRAENQLSQTSNEDRLKEGYVQISKLLNMRDILQERIMFSCLYRKLLVWNDLNIHPGEFCHEKIVNCSQILEDYQEKLGYKPTKMQFEKVSLEEQGYFSPEVDGNRCNSTDTFEIVIQSFIDMEELIKKNFLMAVQSPEKIEEFNANNPVQQTLREQVQNIMQELEKCQAEVKKKRQDQYKDLDNNNKEIDQQKNLEKLKIELEKVKMNYDDLVKQTQKLKQDKDSMKKLQKEAEEKVTKYATQYMPRLKETIKFQKEMQ